MSFRSTDAIDLSSAGGGENVGWGAIVGFGICVTAAAGATGVMVDDAVRLVAGISGLAFSDSD